MLQEFQTMSTLVINGAFVLGVAFLASSIGWWLRELVPPKTAEKLADDKPSSLKTTIAPTTNSPEEKPPEVSLDAFHARDALNELQDMTKAVATDVGEHQDRVISINEQIKAAGADSEGVVALVTSLIQANEKVQQQLQSTEERLQDQTEQLETQALAARTDALTNLLNRRGLDDLLAEQSAKFKHHGTPLCVMISDIDHFKKFNDTYGHQAGDEVLRGVGRVFRETSGELDVPARYGGEEFAVIFPATEMEGAMPRADLIRRQIEQSLFEHEGIELRVTSSVGLAQLGTEEDIGNLVKRADEALYASKRAGRNCGHWHDGEYIHPIDAFKAEEAHERPDVTATIQEQPEKHIHHAATEVQPVREQDAAPVASPQEVPPVENTQPPHKPKPPSDIHPTQPVQSEDIAPAQPQNSPPVQRPQPSKESKRSNEIRPTQPQPTQAQSTRDEPQAEYNPREENPKSVIQGVLDPNEFANEAKRCIETAKDTGQSVSSLKVNIDQLNSLDFDDNELATPTILRAATQILKAAVRRSDVVCLYDDHSFGVLMPATDRSKATMVSERLRRAISRCVLPIEQRGFSFTVSSGVTEMLAGDSQESLSERVDAALSAAEDQGGNCTFFNDGLQCIPASGTAPALAAT